LYFFPHIINHSPLIDMRYLGRRLSTPHLVPLINISIICRKQGGCQVMNSVSVHRLLCELRGKGVGSARRGGGHYTFSREIVGLGARKNEYIK
jgi:hypothetical protein